MNALCNALEPKPRATMPAEPLDFDDVDTHGWPAVIASREARRQALARRFSPTTKEKRR
jgi:hypothetical protein